MLPSSRLHFPLPNHGSQQGSTPSSDEQQPVRPHKKEREPLFLVRFLKKTFKSWSFVPLSCTVGRLLSPKHLQPAFNRQPTTQQYAHVTVRISWWQTFLTSGNQITQQIVTNAKFITLRLRAENRGQAKAPPWIALYAFYALGFILRNRGPLPWILRDIIILSTTVLLWCGETLRSDCHGHGHGHGIFILATYPKGISHNLVTSSKRLVTRDRRLSRQPEPRGLRESSGAATVQTETKP